MKEKYRLLDIDTKKGQYQLYEEEDREELIKKVDYDLSLETSFLTKSYGVTKLILPEKQIKHFWVFFDGKEMHKYLKKLKDGETSQVTPNIMRILKEEQLTDSWIKSLFSSRLEFDKKYIVIIFVVVGAVLFILRAIGVI